MEKRRGGEEHAAQSLGLVSRSPIHGVRSRRKIASGALALDYRAEEVKLASERMWCSGIMHATHACDDAGSTPGLVSAH